MSLGIDLHLHTRASDGQWTPAGLVARAKSIGIRTIAVTDHDVTDAVEPAREFGATHGVNVIPGVEVTVHWQGAPLHLLVYGEAVLSPEIAGLLESARDAINGWVRLRVSGLTDGSVRTRLASTPGSLTITDLVRGARACGVSGDLHEAARYVAATYAGDPPGLALSHVARTAVDVGAITILAHPMRTGTLTRALDVKAINALLDDVPTIMGIEVGHPRHAPAARDALAALAARRAILVTAGSDSHGPARARPPVAWPEDCARAFLECIGR